jgi:DNA repair exonuclease SbcCD ATPase subunit
MSVKLNHYWSVIPGRDEAYVKFVINQFIPGVNSLGLHTVAVWSVLIGAYSEIVLENASSDLEIIEKALKNKQYKFLKQDLFKFVKNYQTKILVNTGKIDSYTMDISKDTIKFNQMWNVLSHKKDEYDQFVINEYYPALNELGISVAGEWEVLIGDGPGIICEGRVSDINNLIRNLQSRRFQNATRELKQHIENYRSRILTLHGSN